MVNKVKKAPISVPVPQEQRKMGCFVNEKAHAT